jgi:hypothetical protein
MIFNFSQDSVKSGGIMNWGKGPDFQFGKMMGLPSNPARKPMIPEMSASEVGFSVASSAMAYRSQIGNAMGLG